MSVLVHKAVEPDNLTVKGRKRLTAMLEAGEFIIQPKHDGVYAQVIHVGTHLAPSGWAAFSRTGEHLPSVRPEILAQFSGLDTSLRFIGELWLPDTPHAVINGLARKKSSQSLDLYLFDVVKADDWMTYRDRYDALADMPWRRGIEVVNNLPVSTQGHPADSMLDYLYELAAKIKAKASAYDGLVLKDSEGVFTPGSGKDGGAIKIKPRQSGDFRVVSCTEGLGNRAGGMGAAVVDLGGGVQCEVGSGFTLADIHDRGCAHFMGRIIEVEYLAITKDGRLREPVYKSVRFDKTAADVLACNVGGSE